MSTSNDQQPKISNQQKAICAATALAIAEPMLALMHAGSLGMIVGLGAGMAGYVCADEIEAGISAARSYIAEKRGQASPSPSASDDTDMTVSPMAKTGNLAYRIFNGKSTRGEFSEDVPVIAQPVAAPRQDKPLTVAAGHLGLSATLQPHANSMLSKRIGMFGVPGSGKSNALRVFCEELGKLGNVGVPFVLADTEGEFGAICSPDYLMRPFAGHAGNVTIENAFQFGQEVLGRGLQVVLDLQSYESDDEAALVMIELIRGMRALAESQENADRASCMFILDEAAIWLPQNQQESMLSKTKDENNQTILAQLQQAFFGTVVRRGRKRGIGFLFATQRIADIDKRCVLCDWLFLFRQTLTNDINRYAELGIPKDATPALAPGEAFVVYPTGAKVVHVLRKSYSPDNSVTPGLASLHQKAETWKGNPTVTTSIATPAPTRQVNTGAAAPASTYEQMALTLLQNGYSLEQVMDLLQSSRPVPSRQTEPTIARIEKLVPSRSDDDDGIIPEPVQGAQNELTEPVPTDLDGVPNLGPNDNVFSQEQEVDFLRRYKKTPDIKKCLSQMVNNRGEIGLSNRFYKHAKWLSENQTTLAQGERL
jgi:hypothetical protein